MSLLQVNNLSVSFPASGGGEIRAVDNISYAIEAGEVMALVGESGSGKSVSSLALLGLLPASATVSGVADFTPTTNNKHPATIPLLSTDENSLRSIRGDDISMIFQEPMTALNPLHTIGKQIAETLHLHTGLSTAQIRNRIEEVLEQVGLEHFKKRLDAYPHQLSGGERQRVMIAMAVINNPRLLIADEPTTAVDVTIQAQILELLKRLQRENNMALLLITHDLTIVRKIADKVAVMQSGKLVERGETKSLFAHPQHTYTRKLLSSEPSGSPLPVAAGAAQVISCENLRVCFPKNKGLFVRNRELIRAVDNISLSLHEGETLGIVGESGSGKTTLAMALLRLIKSEGKIIFLGNRLDGLSTGELRRRRSQMQLVFQDPFSSLNPRMPIVDIIGEGLRVHQTELSRKQRRERVAQILAEVGLAGNMLDRYPHEFSGGQRQRIAIARAMVLKPRFVVLDEPTSALDLTVQAQIAALLRSLQEDHRLAYIFISHDLRVVRAVSHRIAVLRGGKIIEQGSTETIFTRPQNEYTKELIAAAFA